MTLEEAMKNSEDAVVFLAIHHQDRLARGVKLSNEALKRLHKMRHGAAQPIYYLLPGETKD